MNLKTIEDRLRASEKELIEECESHVKLGECGNKCPHISENFCNDDYCFLWDLKGRIRETLDVLAEMENHLCTKRN